MNAFPKNSLKLSIESSRSYIFITTDTWQWLKRAQLHVIHWRYVPQFHRMLPMLTCWQILEVEVMVGSGLGCPMGRSLLWSSVKRRVCFNERVTFGKVFGNAIPFVTRLNNHPVLVMPWLKPCSTDNKKNEIVTEAAKTAIWRFTQSGYCHTLASCWFVRKENCKLQVLLFDFGTPH